MAITPKDAFNAARDIAAHAVEKASDIVEDAGDIIRGDISGGVSAIVRTPSRSPLTPSNGPRKSSPARTRPRTPKRSDLIPHTRRRSRSAANSVLTTS